MAVISGSGAVKAQTAMIQPKPKEKDARVDLVAGPASVSGDAAVQSDKSNGQNSAGD